MGVFVNFGANTKAFMKGINEVGFELKKFEKKFKQSHKGLEILGKKMQSIGKHMTVAVTAPLSIIGYKAVKESAIYEGAMDRFKVVFRGGLDEMLGWAEDFRKEFPLARSEIIAYSSQLADLMVSMDIDRGQASDMTKEWMHLAGALSAFYDVPIEEALSAIKSGLAGMSRPLRHFGIDVRKERVQQEAIAIGLMKTGDVMTEQIRLQAMLSVAYRQSRDEIEGLELQKGSLLWKVEELKASFKDMIKVIGDRLNPIVKGITVLMTELTVVISKMPQPVWDVIIILGGLAAAIGPLLLVFGSLLMIAPQLKAGWMVMSTSVFPKLAVALKGVMASAVPFLAIAAAIAAAAYLIYKNWDKFAPYFESMWNSVQETFTAVWTFIEPLINEIGAIMKDLGDTIWDAVGDDVIKVFESLFKVVAKVFSGIAEMIKWQLTVWGDFFELIKPGITFVADVIGKVLVVAFQQVIDIVSGVIKSFDGLIDMFEGLFTNDNELFVEGLFKFFEGVSEQLLGVVKAPINFLIEGLNHIIRAANNLKIDIPSWLQGALGGATSWGINLTEIPQLASGGIVMPKPGGVLANIAEAGEPEMVLPLSKANSVLGGKTIDLQLILDGEVMAEIVGERLMQKMRVRM